MQVQLITKPARGFGRDALTVSIQQPLLGAKRHHCGLKAELGEGLGSHRLSASSQRRVTLDLPVRWASSLVSSSASSRPFKET